MGVVGSLLAFELVAAVRSWSAASVRRPDEDGTLHRGATHQQPILLSQAFAIRDHFRRQRPFMNDLRSRYAVLRTGRYARQLRMAIGQVQPRQYGAWATACPSCRPSRLRGQAHCPACRRRLLVPVVPAGA